MSEPRTPDDRSIETLLARARRRAIAVHLGAGLAVLVGGLIAAGLVTSLLLGALAPETAARLGWVRILMIGAAALFTAGVAWRLLFVPLRRVGRDVDLAVRLEAALPAAAGLASAVQFSGESTADAGRYSADLARAHVARLARRAPLLDPRPAIPVRPLTRSSAALGMAVAVHLLAVPLFGDTLAAGYRRLAGTDQLLQGLAAGGTTGLPSLITGDVELTYHYPAYTRLPPRTVSGTGGDLAALQGTEVDIRTRADRDVDAAALVVGDQQLPLTVTGGRDLAGRLVVTEPGIYRFRFLDEDGEPVAEGAPHRITVEPDAWPEVTASTPGHDSDEIEIREQERLALEFRAADDFGLTELALVYRLDGGKAQRTVLRRPAEQTREEGRWAWDLTTLHLAPGDRVAWFVEGLDNDAVSGPKKGVSRTRHLKVFSAAEHHRELMAKIEAVWERMIVSLADHLETPFQLSESSDADAARAALGSAEDVHRNLDALIEELAATVGLLAADPLAPPVFVSALDNVRSGLWRSGNRVQSGLRLFRSSLLARERPGLVYAKLVRRGQDDVITELEKDILYLEDLLDKQRIQDLKAMAEELKAHKRRLTDLIEQLRDDPSEEVRAAVSEEISRLKQRIHELMAKMSELAKGIQDAHLNHEAMEALQEQKDLLSGLDDVQKMLNEGQLDEALARLDEMTRGLEAMIEEWNRQDQEFGGEAYQQLAKDVMELVDDLQRVKRDQEKLLDDAKTLESRYREALQERLEGRIEELVELLLEKARAAGEEIQGIPEETLQGGFARFDVESAESAVSRLRELSMLLEASDLDEARETALKALHSVTNLDASLQEQAIEARTGNGLLARRLPELEVASKRSGTARRLAKEIVDALEEVFPDPSEVFEPGEQHKMAGMSRGQDEVRRKTAELEGRMEQLAEQAPIFSPEMGGSLREAARHMGEASQRLARNDARSATGSQKAALERIGRLEEQMRKAMQQGGGQGMPMPFGGGGGGGSWAGFRQEAVEIPDSEQYKPPEAFRRELLEAMKQGAPERYQQQVKRYYEELVR